MVKLILVSGDGGIRDQFELAIPKTPTQDIAMVDYGGRVRDFGISEVRVPGGGVAEETAEPTLDELFEISAGGQVGPTPKASDGPTEQVKMALKGAKSAIDSWLEKNTPVDWKPMNTQPSVANNLYMGEVVRLAYYAPMTPAEVRVSIGRPEVDINVSTKTNDQGMFTVIVRAKTKHNRDWTERTMSMKLADMKKPDKLLGWCRKLRW
jgi:hypothetical protein